MKSTDIITLELEKGAIYNDEYVGFHHDYLVLHCLLRKYKPRKFLEIGTNCGVGTQIIKNALGDNSLVYSLDLPTELAHISLQHPINEGKGDRVGSKCTLPYIQLRGDSMKFDYWTIGNIDGAFIDGEHDYEHPYHETMKIVELQPNIIIWHDSDIPEVWDAINDGLKDAEFWNPKFQYKLYRVEDTRIAYALKLEE